MISLICWAGLADILYLQTGFGPQYGYFSALPIRTVANAQSAVQHGFAA